MRFQYLVCGGKDQSSDVSFEPAPIAIQAKMAGAKQTTSPMGIAPTLQNVSQFIALRSVPSPDAL